MEYFSGDNTEKEEKLWIGTDKPSRPGISQRQGSLLPRAQNHKGSKHKILLRAGKYFLVKTGYRPKYHKVYIAATGSQLVFCSVKKFAKNYFLLNSLMK